MYHIAIIDYLCPFHFDKKMEHFYKTKLKGIADREVSVTPPHRYGPRFANFINQEVIVNDDFAEKQMSVME